MKKQIDKIDQAKNLIDGVIASQKSVDWWEAQVCQIIGQINDLEQDEEANEKEIDKLTNQLASLLPRAKLELKTIDNLEIELKTFIQNQNA